MINIEERINEVDKYLAMAYSKMNKEEDVDYFIDLFWKMVENLMSKTMKYIRAKLKKYKITMPNLIDMLYDDKDEERIRGYFEVFKENKNKLKFLQKLSLIFHTEAEQLINNLILCAAEEVEMELDGEGKVWVHLYSPDGSECGEIFEGDYYWKDVEPHCGHPGCDCYLNDVWVELEDIDKIDLVED